jgi:hypothetical protein
MKSIKKLSAVVALVMLAIFSSCSSSSSDGGGSPVSGSYVTAKVDGAAFTTVISGVSAASASRTGTGADTLIMVLGSNLATNSVSINLYGITATGTYTLNSSSDSVLSYVDSASSAAYGTGICEGSTGTITITYLDATKIEGTFSFTGKDGEDCAAAAKTVTEGAFRGVFAN